MNEFSFQLQETVVEVQPAAALELVFSSGLDLLFAVEGDDPLELALQLQPSLELQVETAQQLAFEFSPSVVTSTTERVIRCLAGAILSSNSFVHITAGGVAVKADAVLGLDAHGFVKEAYAFGAAVEAYQIGTFNGFSSLTPGQDYWLAANAQPTATAPASPSTISQRLGVAVSSTDFAVSIAQPLDLI